MRPTSISPITALVLVSCLLSPTFAAPPTGENLVSLQADALATAETSVPVLEEHTTMKPKRMLTAEQELDNELEKRFRAVQQASHEDGAKGHHKRFRAVQQQPAKAPKEKREAEAEPEPFRAVKQASKPSSTEKEKREAEPEPFRAVKQASAAPKEKREPFRAVLQAPKASATHKEKREAEPFRAVLKAPKASSSPKEKREAEPFRAIFQAPKSSSAPKEKREAEPFRAVMQAPKSSTSHKDKREAEAEAEPIHFAHELPAAKHTKREDEAEEGGLARMARLIKKSGLWMLKREPEPFRAMSNQASVPAPAVQQRSTSPAHDKRSPFGHGQEMRKMIKKLKRDAEVIEARNAEPEESLEARGEQYPLSSAIDYNTIQFSSQSATRSAFSASATASASASSTSSSSSSSSSMPDYWYGASSYYLFALADSERYQVLDALKDGGFKVIRIFIASVGANNKGSNNAAVNDLEPKEVGTYDDTILTKVDQLMYDCSQRGLKLLIALDDRYALGFWSTNTYATQLSIVPAGSSGVQKVSNAAAFYSNSWAIKSFDNRLTHILQHKNALLGYKTWAELDDVVYAFEPQNEPQGYMTVANPTWVCDRAAHLKSLIPSGSSILVGSGGGVTTTTSLQSWATACDSIDIVSVHDYGTSASTTAAALVAAAKGPASGKIVMMGEWGISGNNKAATVKSFVSAFKAAGLPWMYWEVVKPGKAASDFEVWTDEPSWAALTGGAVSSDDDATTSAWKASSTKASTRAWSSSQKAWTSSSPAWSSSSAATPSSTWQADSDDNKSWSSQY